MLVSISPMNMFICRKRLLNSTRRIWREEDSILPKEEEIKEDSLHVEAKKRLKMKKMESATLYHSLNKHLKSAIIMKILKNGIDNSIVLLFHNWMKKKNMCLQCVSWKRHKKKKKVLVMDTKKWKDILLVSLIRNSHWSWNWYSSWKE